MTFLFLILFLQIFYEAKESEIPSEKIDIAAYRPDAKDPFLFLTRRHPVGDRLTLEHGTVLQFTLDFAVWADWDSVVIFASNSTDVLGSYAGAIFSYFNKNGIHVAMHPITLPLLPQSMFHKKHRIGATVVWRPEVNDFINQVSELELFTPYLTWLFIVLENDNRDHLTDRLRVSNVGVDSNVVVCQVERPQVPITRAPVKEVVVPTTEKPTFYRRDAGCSEEYEKDNRLKDICSNQTVLPHRLKRQISVDPNVIVHLNQVYKVSKTDNASLVEKYLGFWDNTEKLNNVEHITDVEERSLLSGYKLAVGIKNTSQDGGLSSLAPSLTQFFHVEDEQEEETHFLELLNCLMFGLNASYELVPYAKLGWRNEEGGWTYLLGAVVDGSLDFALDAFDVTKDELRDMFFSYPIVKTMNNIYFRRSETGGMRDIFLAPFSPCLILCVYFTGVLISVAMVFVTLASYQLVKNSRNNSTLEMTSKSKSGLERSVIVKKNIDRRWEMSEAALWSVGVLCMQGSPWRPSTLSGSLLLMFSLMFALIIYNSYAAFITSVLSVKNLQIKKVEDILKNDFAFGYTLGGTDETFLRTVTDPTLKALYFRGFVNNQGVKEVIDGVRLAATGEYAFFVSARTARRALQTVIPHDQRCGVQELFLPETKTVAALPISWKSPYRRILNFKVLRMMETGILHRIQKFILPSMPRCVERSTFNSAKLTDVYSAFVVLALGWISSVGILIIELVWYNRKHLRGKHSEKRSGAFDGTRIKEKHKFYTSSLYWLKKY